MNICQWPIRKSINKKESHRIFKHIVEVYHIHNYLRLAHDNFFDNIMIYFACTIISSLDLHSMNTSTLFLPGTA